MKRYSYSKSVLFTFVISISLLFTSCAFHSGTYISGGVIANPQFRICGIAKGQAGTAHFLGIGGLSKNALVLEAKRDLYKHTPLRPDMTIVNVTVDFKRSLFFIISKTTVFISGEILEYDTSHIMDNYSGFYTADSTFFPTQPAGISSAAYSSDVVIPNGHSDFDVLRVGDAVKFRLNNQDYIGRLEAINNYGFRCSYQPGPIKRYIYLKGSQLRKP